jgi:hypothetical protein
MIAVLAAPASASTSVRRGDVNLEAGHCRSAGRERRIKATTALLLMLPSD